MLLQVVLFLLQKSRLKNELTALENSQQIQQNHLEQKQLQQLQESQLNVVAVTARLRRAT